MDSSSGSITSYLYWILLLHTLCTLAIADASCRFPDGWHGKWFQSGLGDVTITANTVTKKGNCVKQDNDFYLVENSEKRCQQCLLITQKHHNILQYKETFCIKKELGRNVCGTISTDGILYTLIREEAKPVECPFQGSYYFAYDNNTGYCSVPKSYIRGCASESHFRFHYKKCPALWETREMDLDFQCLATWKDGSDYMYGKFSGRGMEDKDRVYRCFMYDVKGTMVWLSMSADATCRGLISATDGPMKMELTSDQFGWPAPTCQYPNWLRHMSWRDLSGRHTYELDDKKQVIRILRQGAPGVEPTVISMMRCVRISEKNTTQTKFVAVSYSTDGCKSRRQCIKILYRDDNVVEIHRGADMDPDQYTDECKGTDFRSVSKQLLIPTSIKGTKCPFGGRYESEADGCIVNIKSGCNQTSRLQIDTSCPEVPAGHLQCLATWTEKGSMFMVAKKASSSTILANCFRFKNHSHGMITFQTDRHCNMQVPNIFSSDIKYSFRYRPERCRERTIGKGTTQVLVEPEKSGEGGFERGGHVLKGTAVHGGASRRNEWSLVALVIAQVLVYTVRTALAGGWRLHT